MANAPAFQFYPNDFLSDPNTLVMSAEEIGVYCLLLFTCWKEDGLVTNTKKLSRIARIREKKFLALWENSISACFYIDADSQLYRNKRLDKEFKKQQDKREETRRAANTRWHADECGRNADAMQTQCSSSSSSSSSSNSDSETESGEQKPAAQIDPVERRIWSDGLGLLTNTGMKQAPARSLLGRLAKDHGRIALAMAIAATQAANAPDPKAYLIKTCKGSGKYRDRVGGHETEPNCKRCQNVRRVDDHGLAVTRPMPCPECRAEDYAWCENEYGRSV